MSEVKNDRFLKALRKQPVDKTPIWIMRQAGRYLPEYRATRAKAGDFLTLCKTPELACEVTLQPLKRFELDAAILFSDILTIPDAMGLGLYFAEGEGPRFEKTVRTTADIHRLGVIDPHQELRYVVDAVTTIKQALNQSVPLIGFSGSPWTLATYMIEGGSSKSFSQSKRMMYSEPESLKQLVNCLADNVIAYCQAQIDAGVDAVMIFDTWGGILTPSAYREFSLAPMQRIVEGLKAKSDTPIILFTKNAGLWLEDIAATGTDGVGIDWTIDIRDAQQRIGQQVAIQGNMDPGVLYGTPEIIRQEAQKIIAGFGAQPGHIFNLGHGITPDVDPENVAVLVDAVHEFSSQ